jgi:tetratricopeptide (TPR) repeat protein
MKRPGLRLPDRRWGNRLIPSFAMGEGRDMDSAPASFEQAYDEACRLYQAQKLDDALAAFARAATLRPSDFRPWEMTACCLGNLGRWAESLEAFDRAGQLGHECAQCWYNRSIALCRLRRGAEALQALDRSLALDENNPGAWYDRGLILGMAHGRAEGESEPFDGRHEQAVASFDRVLELQPEHYGAWYCKAYTLYKISHSWMASQRLIAGGAAPDIVAQALVCARRAIELQPNRPEARALEQQILDWMSGTG